MKERPILFSGAMVRAILSGAKTQTRRICKPQPVSCDQDRDCHYGQPGDRLWVKETWCTSARLNDRSPKEIERAARRAGYATGPCCPVRYVADGQSTQWGDCDTHDFGRWGKTRVSIHMPRWASRLTLEITGVRVERLQAISEADAAAEGCDGNCPIGHLPAYMKGPLSYHYAQLWESINGPGSWEANPWVWVVSFRRIGQCAREVCNAIPREHLPQVGTELIARPTPARGKCAEERAIDAAMGGENG